MFPKASCWRHSCWAGCLGLLALLAPTQAGVTKNRVVLDVTTFGAVGDGLVDDTIAIQTALQVAAQQQQDQEETIVYFPQGNIFVSTPLNLTSNTILQIDGTLQAVNNATSNILETWPQLPPLPTYGNSRDSHFGDESLGYIYQQYQSFLYARDATNLVIRGTGTIDGQGRWWWDLHQNRIRIPAGRPNLIQFFNCSRVEITGVTLKDAPFWTLHPVLSQHIYIHHMSIRAPMYAPNVDGIDPDSSRHVLIEHNDISCGDDHIAIKAGVCGDEKAAIPCQDNAPFANGDYVTKNITIRYNIFRAGMGIALGSELSGGIEDVHVYQNTIGLCEHGADNFETFCGWGYAIHLKTTLTRGGWLRNIDFHTNIIYNNTGFLFLETDYQSGHDVTPPDYPTTDIQNISIQSNSGLGLALGVTFGCSEYMVCENVTFRDNYIRNATSENYHCAYVDTYQVDQNLPDGMDKCMYESMNRSTAIMHIETA